MARNKVYTKTGMVADIILTLMTGGLWLIYVLFREIRNHQ